MTDPKDDGVRLAHSLANILADETTTLVSDRNLLRIVISKQERNLIVAALRVAPVPHAEPVAWRWQHVNDVEHEWHYQEKPIGNHNEYIQVEPLYAAPPSHSDAGSALELAHCIGRYMSETSYRQRLSFKAAEFVANRLATPETPSHD